MNSNPHPEMCQLTRYDKFPTDGTIRAFLVSIFDLMAPEKTCFVHLFVDLKKNQGDSLPRRVRQPKI